MAANLRTWLQEWGGQPDGVASPVQEGPFSAPALLWNAATPRINLANGVTPTGDGTGVSERAGPYGKEASFSGSGTGRYIFATAPEQDAVTIAVEARIDSAANIDRLVSAYNGAGYGKYDIYYDNASGRWVWQSFRETTNGSHRFNSEVIGAFSGTLVVTCAALTGAPTAFFNGRPVSIFTAASGSGAVVAASSVFAIGGRPDVTDRQMNGGISTVWRLDRALPASAAQMLSEPGALSRLLYEPRRIWVPVSAAGGGAITIDGNLGNATAAGAAGQVGVAITVDASTGNATAAGTTAQVGVSIDITGSVGNAAAAGVTGLPGVSLDIASTTGNAVAAGITGAVDLGGSITIDGNVGAAVAAGVQGLPGVAITIDGATGGAVAAGVSGGVTVTNDITINATAGNAVAAGILAGLSLDIEVAGVIGNATAAGTTGTVSLAGSGTGATAAEIWSYTLSNGLTAEATVVAIHTMLSELHLIHGLTAGSPLSVTAASRAAGAVSQVVDDRSLTAGTVTVTRQ